MPEIRVFGQEEGASMTIPYTPLGFIDDSHLYALYGSALAYIHPSRFEGFGLPLAEAMQVGTPVIAPKGSAVSEVAGEGAFGSVESAARYLAEIIVNRVRWKSASDAALQRAKLYRWDRCAGIIAAQMSQALQQTP
jgi:alpha-1,3-rhamnosyl/mannosyltransferase